jgi:Holliday junction DNA helicase RuvA
MISSLRGVVLHSDADSVIVEVGGVGFSVAVPPDVARGLRGRRDASAHEPRRA